MINWSWTKASWDNCWLVLEGLDKQGHQDWTLFIHHTQLREVIAKKSEVLVNGEHRVKMTGPAFFDVLKNWPALKLKNADNGSHTGSGVPGHTGTDTVSGNQRADSCT